MRSSMEVQTLNRNDFFFLLNFDIENTETNRNGNYENNEINIMVCVQQRDEGRKVRIFTRINNIQIEFWNCVLCVEKIANWQMRERPINC